MVIAVRKKDGEGSRCRLTGRLGTSINASRVSKEPKKAWRRLTKLWELELIDW
jgi:hypothetical protein